MTNTIKFCPFCDNTYTKNCRNTTLDEIQLSETGKIMTQVIGYTRAYSYIPFVGADYTKPVYRRTRNWFPNGEWYNPDKWQKVFEKKPITPFKGCRNGNCRCCYSSVLPFFAEREGKLRLNKSYAKAKSFKKQFSQWMKTELRELNEEMIDIID